MPFLPYPYGTDESAPMIMFNILLTNVYFFPSSWYCNVAFPRDSRQVNNALFEETINNVK